METAQYMRKDYLFKKHIMYHSIIFETSISSTWMYASCEFILKTPNRKESALMRFGCSVHTPGIWKGGWDGLQKWYDKDTCLSRDTEIYQSLSFMNCPFLPNKLSSPERAWHLGSSRWVTVMCLCAYVAISCKIGIWLTWDRAATANNVRRPRCILVPQHPNCTHPQRILVRPKRVFAFSGSIHYYLSLFSKSFDVPQSASTPPSMQGMSHHDT